jgi:hypothetical protein
MAMQVVFEEVLLPARPQRSIPQLSLPVQDENLQNFVTAGQKRVLELTRAADGSTAKRSKSGDDEATVLLEAAAKTSAAVILNAVTHTTSKVRVDPAARVTDGPAISLTARTAGFPTGGTLAHGKAAGDPH